MDVVCTMIGFAIVGAFVFWLVQAIQRGNAAWNALIAEHHLDVRYEHGRRRVSGQIGKTPFRYEHHKDWSDIYVPIPREEMGDLYIGREHAFSKVAKAFGGQDITFDDPTFDDKWRVTSKQPEIARHILKRSIRIAFHNVQADLGWRGALSLAEGHLRWTSQVITPQEIPTIVRTLGKCARKFAPKPPKETSDDGVDALEGD